MQFETKPDTHVHFRVYWDVADPAKFRQGYESFTELTKNEAANVYYGFTELEGGEEATRQGAMEAVCKEGYTSAQGFLDHLGNVDGPVQAALQVASITKIEAHGPAAELAKLKAPLKDFPLEYWDKVDGAFEQTFWSKARWSAGEALKRDRKVHVMVHWDIQDLTKWKEAGEEFTAMTANEPENVYYGFTVLEQGPRAGDRGVCKEGYRSAEAFLKHLQNVDSPLKKALEVASISKIEVHGPAAQIAQLKAPLQDFPVEYWSAADGAYFYPEKVA
jgi:hypothetical protein